jgi:hypothetical protein
MADDGRKAESALEKLQSLFDQPEQWLDQYQERRAALEKLQDDHKRKRGELEAAQKAEIEKLLGAFSEEMKAPSEALWEVAPIHASDVEAIPRRRAAYSDRMAALLSKLSMLSYIGFENPDRRPVLERQLEHGGLKLIDAIAVDDTECIVVEARDFLAVAFRGTTSKADRKTDFRISVGRALVENHPQHVRVHAGFYDAYKLVEQRLHAAIKAVPGKSVYLAGHSLGGAVALVASAALGGSDELGNRVAAVYTFGSPRVGGRDFPAIVKAPHYRVVISGDVVPLVPPSWLNGYVHTGEPYLLKGKALKPVRKRPTGSVVVLAIRSLFLWPFSRKLLVSRHHDIALYAARLDRIARNRGRWS